MTMKVTVSVNILVFLAHCMCAPIAHSDEGTVSVPRAESAERLSVTEVAERVGARVRAQKGLPARYSVDLQLEGLLALDDATGTQKHLPFVQQVMIERGMPPSYVHAFNKQYQVFGNLAFELFERTRDRAYVRAFIDESRKYRAENPRAFDGAIVFDAVQKPTAIKIGGATVYFDPALGPTLIDQIQEYASRMAKTGYLTGEESFYAEALTQLQLARASLRDPETGLWGHGRGWYATEKTVSHTKWGRGNGWLIRGLVESLTYLPPDSAYAREVCTMLSELAQALLKHQDPEGLWHQVIDRPESFAETSGTALISYYFARAVRQGLLPEQPYREAASRAFKGLTRHKISREGVVYGTARENPPLPTAEDYMRWETPVDDPHGVGAVLLSAAGQLLLENKASDAGAVMKSKGEGTAFQRDQARR